MNPYVSPVNRIMAKYGGKPYVYMTLPELERYARDLQRLANQRYNALINASKGVRTEALNRYPVKEFAEGGLISLSKGFYWKPDGTRGYNPNQNNRERVYYLRHEINRAQKFLNSGYSSVNHVQQIRAVRDSIIKQVASPIGYQYYKRAKYKNSDFEHYFWECVDMFRDFYFRAWEEYGSERCIAAVTEVFYNHGNADMSNARIRNVVDSAYLLLTTGISSDEAWEVVMDANARERAEKRAERERKKAEKAEQEAKE